MSRFNCFLSGSECSPWVVSFRVCEWDSFNHLFSVFCSRTRDVNDSPPYERQGTNKEKEKTLAVRKCEGAQSSPWPSQIWPKSLWQYLLEEFPYSKTSTATLKMWCKNMLFLFVLRKRRRFQFEHSRPKQRRVSMPSGYLSRSEEFRGVIDSTELFHAMRDTYLVHSWVNNAEL